MRHPWFSDSARSRHAKDPWFEPPQVRMWVWIMAGTQARTKAVSLEWDENQDLFCGACFL